MIQYGPQDRFQPADNSIIVREDVGPMDDCAAAVWAMLVNFERWQDWLPGLHKATRQDDGALGRGSTFLLQGRGLANKAVEICHWHPGHRLDLLFSEPRLRIGYCFLLVPTPDPRMLSLHVVVEVEYRGLYALIGSLLRIAERRRAGRILLNLLHCVQRGD